jgi:predicted kinase
MRLDFDSLQNVDILLIGGLQGSGKSSLATSFFPNRRRVNRDEIRAFHTRMTRSRDWRPEDWSARVEPMVSAIEMAILRYELEHDRSVVIDNTVITEELRAPYVALARQLGKTVGCLFLHLPLEFCKQQNRQRDRQVPEEVLDHFHSSLELPRDAEGLDVVKVVDEPFQIH